MAKKRKVKKSKELDNSGVTESHTNICEMCEGKLVKAESKVIGGIEYDILKCERCKHTLARHVNEEQ